MTEPKSDEKKAESKADREARKAANEATELEERKKLLARRAEDLKKARVVIEKVKKELKNKQKTAESTQALLNHSLGVYDEVNKLTKGRSLVEVTNLLVQQTNDIVRDAKEIVKQDVYLDRTKEFVPAGNNPVYPDVLLTVRVVRESLGRWGKKLVGQSKRLQGLLKRAHTVVGALECFLSGEENSEYPLKTRVREYADGDIDDSCFSWAAEPGIYYFDFEKFDDSTLEHYLSIDMDEDPKEGDEGGLAIDWESDNLREEQGEEE